MQNKPLKFHLESLKTFKPEKIYPDWFVQSAITLMEHNQEHKPFMFDVTCEQITSLPVGSQNEIQVALYWQSKTMPASQRLFYGTGSERLVEFASIALAFLFAIHLLNCTDLEVTHKGDRGDYFIEVNGQRLMMEISGTEGVSRISSVHEKKRKQLLKNPYGMDGYVVIGCFSGHKARFSYHSQQQRTGVWKSIKNRLTKF